MAKLKLDPIDVDDLVEFLTTYSDFSFEIQVLNTLVANGFECDHGGTYDDPITKKPRQFDIRATRIFNKFYLRLAVECKNLKTNFPILICCLPRRNDESFNEIAFSVNPETHPLKAPSGPYSIAMLPISKSIRLTGEHSLYKAGQPVGKACEQVGRLTVGNDFVANDSGVYDKWSQALSSAHDLTYMACSDGKMRTGNFAISIVIPVVVVPNGCLWVTYFDKDGKRTNDPQLIERCSYFVGRSYYHRGSEADELTLSHLEFVTLNGLVSLVDNLCGTDIQLETTFPKKYILEHLNE